MSTPSPTIAMLQAIPNLTERQLAAYSQIIRLEEALKANQQALNTSLEVIKGGEAIVDLKDRKFAIALDMIDAFLDTFELPGLPTDITRKAALIRLRVAEMRVGP